MSVAFVLGNGVSRKGLDLTSLQKHGVIYGCNALYRDFVPDVLVATDKPIREEIQHSGYAIKHKFYTRFPLEGLGGLEVPKQYWGYSSGPIAVSLAALDNFSDIYMLGFDMGPDNNQFNNVYAGTEFYKNAGAHPTFTGNWVRQITQVAKDFKNLNFVRVKGDTTADIPDLSKLPNIKHLSIQEFAEKFCQNI
jgi:hypothetical protein